MNAKTVTAAAVNPATFHLDCIDHLCQLECDLSEVRSDAGEGPSIAKINALRKILASISDFAEPRFSATAFNKLAVHIHKMYGRTKSLEEMFNNASWSSIKRLFGHRSASNSNDELIRSYEQLNKDFNLFLVEFFVVCVKRFGTGSEEKRVFLESVDTFISDVDKIWN